MTTTTISSSPINKPPPPSEAHVFISVLLICVAAGAVQIFLGKMAARFEVDARRRVWLQNASTFAACFCAGSTYRTWRLEYLGFPLVSTLIKTICVTGATTMLPSSSASGTTKLHQQENNVTKFVYLPIFGIIWGFEECLLSTVEQVEDVSLAFATIGTITACAASRLVSPRFFPIVSFVYLPLASIGLIIATFPFVDKVDNANLIVATVLRALRLSLAEYLFSRDYVPSSTALIRRTGPFAILVCAIFAVVGEILPSFGSLLAHALEIIGLLVPDVVFTYFTIIATKELVRDTSTCYSYALVNVLAVVLVMDSASTWKLEIGLLACGCLAALAGDVAVVNHLFKREFSSSSSSSVSATSANNGDYERVHYDNPFWSPQRKVNTAYPSKTADLGGDDDEEEDLEADEEFLNEGGNLIAPSHSTLRTKRRVASPRSTAVIKKDDDDDDDEEDEQQLQQSESANLLS